MSWLSNLLDRFLKFLDKLWEKIKPFIAVLALVVLVLAPVLAPWMAALAWPAWASWVPAAFTALGNAGWVVSSLVGLGVAAVIDTDAVVDIVESVGEVASSVGEQAGEVVGDFLGGGVSALLSSPLGWVLIGGLVIWGVSALNTSSGNTESGVSPLDGGSAPEDESQVSVSEQVDVDSTSGYGGYIV